MRLRVGPQVRRRTWQSALRVGLLATLAALGLTVTANSAHALSCVQLDGRERDAFRKADAAFAGHLVATRRLPSLASLLIDQDNLDDAVYTFRVRRVYKGRLPATVDVVGM